MADSVTATKGGVAMLKIACPDRLFSVFVKYESIGRGQKRILFFIIAGTSALTPATNDPSRQGRSCTSGKVCVLIIHTAKILGTVPQCAIDLLNELETAVAAWDWGKGGDHSLTETFKRLGIDAVGQRRLGLGAVTELSHADWTAASILPLLKEPSLQPDVMVGCKRGKAMSQCLLNPSWTRVFCTALIVLTSSSTDPMVHWPISKQVMSPYEVVLLAMFVEL